VTCSSSEALFEGFLEGELVPRERTALLAHVDTCAACRGLLEELRVVDALLLEPRAVRLAPNFTFATMAEVRALPAPRVRRPPVLAFTVSYLAAAWLLVGATFLLAPQVMLAAGMLATMFAHSTAGALRGFERAFSGAGDATVLVGCTFALDLALIVAIGAAFAFARPRLAERLRS
jgi:anti-sigma factor RsiW